MKINQVEELVDITKKNIRFYEDQGLLSPERNPENGYREYSLKDVDELLKIKFMRKMSIPLEDIRRVQHGQLTLSECFEGQSERLKNEIRSLDAALVLCGSMKEKNLDYSDFKAGDYLDEIKKLEEGGHEFMDVSKVDVKKKKTGAIIAASAFILLIAVFVLPVLIFGAFGDVPVPIIIFFTVFGSVLIIGCVRALSQRIHELEGGEENEARKY